MQNEIWPNFFIVGASKSGTTSLYEYLRKTPGVYMSELKAPSYFAPNVIPDKVVQPIRKKADYLALFKGVNGQSAIGEASDTYLPDVDSPRLIHETIPNAKIIMILRHPVERAFSHYLMEYRNGTERLPFLDAVKKEMATPISRYAGERRLTQLGMYSEQVKRYLDTFGKQQVKILIFEEFIANTAATMNEVLRFLDIDEQPFENMLEEVYNQYAAPRNSHIINFLFLVRRLSIHNKAVRLALRATPRIIKDAALSLAFKQTPKPMMSKDERAYLEDIYYDDVLKLSNLIGRSLPWSFITK